MKEDNMSHYGADVEEGWIDVLVLAIMVMCCAAPGILWLVGRFINV